MRFRNILLIDDDEDDREIFQSALDTLRLPIASTTLGSAVEALEKLTTGIVAPDVIFLDLNMPLMNGQEFLRRIKTMDGLSAIPVIIFSTSRSHLSILKAKEFGAQDYITKPYSLNELVKVLDRILSE